MSLPHQLALVSEGVDIDSSDMTKVAAALSKQIQRDFSPIWRVDATVDAFVSLDDVPIDYWPIVVMRDVQGAAGFHQDENEQPFAVVEYSDDWSLTASHECLEMLADPFGRRLRAGNLLDQAVSSGLAPGRVRYLVEVCDPSESGQFAYTVNGILVSDFYTPQFFDPVQSPGTRYSFTSAIDSPRKVLDGGYISWHDPVSKHWLQVRMFSDEFSALVPHVVDLTTQTEFEKLKGTHSLRGAMDRITTPPEYRRGIRDQELVAAKSTRDTSSISQRARGEGIRRQIAALARGKDKKRYRTA
jgi:hypothetical protein